MEKLDSPDRTGHENSKENMCHLNSELRTSSFCTVLFAVIVLLVCSSLYISIVLAKVLLCPIVYAYNKLPSQYSWFKIVVRWLSTCGCVWVFLMTLTFERTQ